MSRYAREFTLTSESALAHRCRAPRLPQTAELHGCLRRAEPPPAQLYATQGSNPGLAGRVSGRSATHTFGPRVASPRLGLALDRLRAAAAEGVLDAVDRATLTALHLAAARGLEAAVASLLQLGARVDSPSPSPSP